MPSAPSPGIPRTARYYPEDDRFLLDLPERVIHWEDVSEG